MTEIRLAEARDLFSQELTFPVSCSEVIGVVGDVHLQSPTGSTESLGDVLGRCEGEVVFESNDELYDTLVTYLGEAHIGRKNYDDRGSNPQHDEEVSL
jgi:hypothetical protein